MPLRHHQTADGLMVNEVWEVQHTDCPACHLRSIFLKHTIRGRTGADKQTRFQVYPKALIRPLPEEVPDGYKADFNEASLILSDSPKASAALSRRLLQRLLMEQGGSKKKELAEQIQEVLDSGKMSSDLADAIDAIRNVGLFGAHPKKSTNSGEILDVEPGEAEWSLEVLEQLLDFYFVRPAKLRARKDALNLKLKDAGKPVMK